VAQALNAGVGFAFPIDNGEEGLFVEKDLSVSDPPKQRTRHVATHEQLAVEQDLPSREAPKKFVSPTVTESVGDQGLTIERRPKYNGDDVDWNVYHNNSHMTTLQNGCIINLKGMRLGDAVDIAVRGMKHTIHVTSEKERLFIHLKCLLDVDVKGFSEKLWIEPSRDGNADLWQRYLAWKPSAKERWWAATGKTVVFCDAIFSFKS